MPVYPTAILDSWLVVCGNVGRMTFEKDNGKNVVRSARWCVLRNCTLIRPCSLATLGTLWPVVFAYSVQATINTIYLNEARECCASLGLTSSFQFLPTRVFCPPLFYSLNQTKRKGYGRPVVARMCRCRCSTPYPLRRSHTGDEERTIVMVNLQGLMPYSP